MPRYGWNTAEVCIKHQSINYLSYTYHGFNLYDFFIANLVNFLKKQLNWWYCFYLTIAVKGYRGVVSVQLSTDSTCVVALLLEPVCSSYILLLCCLNHIGLSISKSSCRNVRENKMQTKKIVIVLTQAI
jgi:hypothetical protein